MLFLTKILNHTLFYTLKSIGWKKHIFEANNRALALNYDYVTTLKNLCLESALIISNFKTTVPNYQITEQTRDILEQMKKESSILLTAHISNQEFFGAILKKEGVDLRAYHQELNSPFWNNLLKNYRIKNGNYSPYSIKNIKDALNVFKTQNFTIAFLWDQHNSSPQNKIFKLNELSYSPHRIPYSFEKLSHNLFVGTLFKQGDCYSIQIKKIDTLEHYSAELEHLIKTHTNQWFGIFHKIFKTHINYQP